MYEQQTAEIMVRVAPHFLPQESKPSESRYLWAYDIEIENRGRDAVQLISRLWRITDANGLTHEVHGPGVIGLQPVIKPGESFRYSSAAPLAAPSGMMHGAYAMVRLGDGAAFNVAVPVFALDSPHQTQRAN